MTTLHAERRQDRRASEQRQFDNELYRWENGKKHAEGIRAALQRLGASFRSQSDPYYPEGAYILSPGECDEIRTSTGLLPDPHLRLGLLAGLSILERPDRATGRGIVEDVDWGIQDDALRWMAWMVDAYLRHEAVPLSEYDKLSGLSRQVQEAEQADRTKAFNADKTD